MRFAMKAPIASLVLIVAILLVPASWAQTNSNIGNVALSATLTDSLTIKINSGAAVNWPALAANTAAQAGSTTTSVTTAWVLKPGRTSVAVWAYFTSLRLPLSFTRLPATPRTSLLQP